MKKLLLISSLMCLALLLYAPIDEFMLREFHDHQRRYRQHLMETAENDTEREAAKNYKIKIRQYVLPDLKRVDRCISCHVGIEDPKMADRPNPLRAHPGDYLKDHDVRKIGCTVCHDGQGRALTFKDALALAGVHWDKPLLKPPFIQANCMRCHDVEELPGLEMVKRGQDLFLNNGCLGCHKFEGKGGQLAPELTYIADASPHLKYPVKLTEEKKSSLLHGNPNLAYIFESIKAPNAQPEITAMVDFHFADEEILALTVFLKGLSKREIPASYLAKRNQIRQRETFRGKALFNKYCIACHGKDGKGGVINRNYAKETVPALNTMAEKLFIEYKEDAEYLAELLMDGVDIENMSPPLDMEGRPRVLAQYRAIKDVIKKGSTAARAENDGPAPLLHMPNWGDGLTDSAVDSILAYMLLQYPWNE